MSYWDERPSRHFRRNGRFAGPFFQTRTWDDGSVTDDRFLSERFEDRYVFKHEERKDIHLTLTLVKYDLDEETGRLVPREVGSFSQFPLRLAWASTIHKMQGQTVDRIKIDLSGGAFEAGMTYVALSRCRTMEGIRLTRPLVAADLVVDAGVLRYLESVKTRD